MKAEARTRFWRLVTAVLMVAIIATGLSKAYPHYLRSRALKRRGAELDAEIAMRHKQLTELAENRRRFKTDPDFVESIARQNRWVYPGEYVFIFESDK